MLFWHSNQAGSLMFSCTRIQVRYPKQKVLVVAVMEYVYLVPHVEEADYLFLKTIIPSRKATRDYGRKDKP